MSGPRQVPADYCVPLQRVSSLRPSRQVTTTVPLEVLNSAFASRIADATAEVRFLRATTSVATPFRNTSQVCAVSSHWMRYSILAIFSESRGRSMTADRVLSRLVGIAKFPKKITPKHKTVTVVSSIRLDEVDGDLVSISSLAITPPAKGAD